jgi:hypothetical protein
MNIKRKISIGLLSVFSAIAVLTLTSSTMNASEKVAETVTETNAYLEITLDISDENRASAGAVYVKYKEPFLTTIDGATSKELLMRTEDVQVLHGFSSKEAAEAYLTSELFQNDVVNALTPYLQSDPEIRIYTVFKAN